VPAWLAEVVRPKPAPVPWPDMARAALAICVPLAAGMALGHAALGALPAMGGLMGVMVDNGGPYVARMQRVAAAAVFGGAPGLVIGALIHGRGWVAVVVLVTVAGVSAVLSTLGATGSVTGLQLLVYAALGLGPLGAHRPWWTEAVGFVAGAVWALMLLIPGWLVGPRAAEQHAVAGVYHKLADAQRAIGTPSAPEARRNVTAALNQAYDMVLTARSLMGGRTRRLMRLTTLLNASHLVAEATTTLRVEGSRPPPLIIATLDHLADVIGEGGAVPVIPPPWGNSHGERALRDALVTLAELLSAGGRAATAPIARPSLRERMSGALDQLRPGTVGATFALRLMACTGVAAVLSEVVPIQRSYWVLLTTVIVLKPDYGSVFARALQRGLGTIVGAGVGAVILVLVPYGPWLLVPFAVLAAMLPYGRARNFGLAATFLTPVVVLLTDILTHTGWKLAEDRLLDTVLGCLVVLVVGYAPWPMSWHAHLPDRLESTIRTVCGYMQEALIPAESGPAGAAAAAPPQRSRMRRRTSRAISDLRAEFQRTMSEPTQIRRRAATLWPAVVGLDEVVEAVTATAVRIRRGADAPDPSAVRQLAAALESAASPGGRVAGPLPDDPALKPVTTAVRSVLGVLAPS
jgi:uncharacterized membrane protein YccC